MVAMVRNLSLVTTAPARTAAPSARTAEPTESRPINVSGAGKPTPSDGKDLPAAKRVEKVDLSQALEQLTKLARSKARNLQFSVDEVSGRTVITVINASTAEIVRQIPSEEVLALARNSDGFGALIDAEA
jgi:flagellar protein FlaG